MSEVRVRSGAHTHIQLLCLALELCSSPNTLYCSAPRPVLQPVLSTRASVQSEGSIQDVPCCPLVMMESGGECDEEGGEEMTPPSVPSLDTLQEWAPGSPLPRVGINS